MSVLTVLDILTRFILILLTILSFIPQLRTLQSKRDSEGLSFSYLLLNLILLTHAFNIYLHIVVVAPEAYFSDDYGRPRGVRDWLDFAQVAASWSGQLMLFVSALMLPPKRLGHKVKVAVAYCLFAAMTLFPTLFEAFLERKGREFYTAMIGSVLLFIAPVMQLCGVAALLLQAHQIKTRCRPGALNIQGLAVQGILFLLVGGSFIWRLWMPMDEGWDWEGIPGWAVPYVVLREWYSRVGWATMNHLIFAVGQGGLWLMARDKVEEGEGDGEEEDEDGEREALLRE